MAEIFYTRFATGRKAHDGGKPDYDPDVINRHTYY